MCDVHPSFLRKGRPTARLAHRCDECWKTIMPGEVYVTATGCWDGEVDTYRAHVLCDLLAERIGRDEEGCRIFGEMKEFAAEARLTPLQARWFEALTGKHVGAEEE